MMKSFFISLLLLFAVVAKSQPFYTAPSMNFIGNPVEIVTELAFTSLDISQVQANINAARLANPTNVIRITLTGLFTITDSPLQLSDKMLLFLKNATVEASPASTASCLISVFNAKFVSIGGTQSAIVDGKNLVGLKGISVVNSGKTHIDNIVIQNCAMGGISYIGKGSSVYADAGSVTRTLIQNSGEFGIKFTDSFNFVCSDNTINNCIVGISVMSDNAVVSKNNISNCSTAIALNGYLDVITYNSCNNNGTAIALYNSGSNANKSEALVSHNTIIANTLAFSVNSNFARVYYNTCDGNINLISGTFGASNNYFFCNTGISAGQEGGYGIFFNPPTIGNEHNDLIKTGKSRFDLTINSSSNNSILNIRSLIDAAIIAHSNAVIVAHLNGDFITSTASDSLLIKDNVCILLDGTIRNAAGDVSSMLYFKDNIISSFSGGTIDGANVLSPNVGVNGSNALIYITGSANIILDHISVKNSAGEGITKRNSTNPTFIQSCIVNNSIRRGIWQLASNRLFAFENTISYSGIGGSSTTGNTFDGIDLDAYSQTAVIVNNSVTNNTRFGVFIEEGAANHCILSNTLNSNNRGLSFYNRDVANKNCSKNLVAFNKCRFNVRGLHLDAYSNDRATTDNVLFNNISENNSEQGIGGFYNANSTLNNYCALNSIQSNALGPFYSNRDYTSNTVWNLLAKDNITLPIHTSFFDGKINGSVVFLKWMSVIDHNSNFCEIQKSSNSSSFFTIGTRLLQVINAETVAKQFIDEFPYEGLNYYRIKSYDKDGSFSFSEVIAIKNVKKSSCNISSLYQMNDCLEFSVETSLFCKEIEVSIIDMNGNKRFASVIKTDISHFSERIIALPKLSSGMYVFCVKSAYGFDSKKIIIKN